MRPHTVKIRSKTSKCLRCVVLCCAAQNFIISTIRKFVCICAACSLFPLSVVLDYVRNVMTVPFVRLHMENRETRRRKKP